MSRCKEWRWNKKRHSKYDNLSPNVEGAGYIFELKQEPANVLQLPTYFPNPCRKTWIGRKDNLDARPSVLLQPGYISDKTQLPKPSPKPGIGIPIPLSTETDTYDSLCSRGRPPGLIESGGLNSLNPCESYQRGLVINTLQQIFDEVCGCAATQFPFEACPGVAYYVRWKQRQSWKGWIQLNPNDEGFINPSEGWFGAQVINEGTDDAYITYQFPLYAPIKILGYYNYGNTGFSQQCRQHNVGFQIQYSQNPNEDTKSLLSFADNEFARAITVNFGVGQHGSEAGIICGWKIEKIQFLRYYDAIPGIRPFDLDMKTGFADEFDPLCPPPLVPYPKPMPCEPLIIYVPYCDEQKPEPEPDKPEPQPCDEYPICKNGIRATFICPEDEMPPKPCEPQPDGPKPDCPDKPEPCPEPCTPCDKPEPCPQPQPCPSPDKPEPCPQPQPCLPPDKPEPCPELPKCSDGSSPICPEDDDMKDCCDFSLIITEIQNTKLDLKLEINNTRLDIINNVQKLDVKVTNIDANVAVLVVDVKAIALLLAQLKIELKVDFDALFKLINNLEFKITNNFNFKAEFEAIFKAIANLKAELALEITNNISLKFDPKFELVLQAIAKLEVNLIAKFELALNAKIELGLQAIANLKAEIKLDIRNELKLQLDLQLQLLRDLIINLQNNFKIELGKIEFNLKSHFDFKIGDLNVDVRAILKLLSDVNIELGDIKINIEIILKKLEECKDESDQQFSGSGLVEICEDEALTASYNGKGLQGLSNQIEALIKLTSYGLTELAKKVCEGDENVAGLTCFVFVSASGCFSGQGSFTGLSINVQNISGPDCQAVADALFAPIFRMTVDFNQSVRNVIDALSDAPGADRNKSDLELLGLTPAHATLINQGLAGITGQMQVSTARAIISIVLQNALVQITHHESPIEPPGEIDITVPDIFDGSGAFVTGTTIDVTNLSGAEFEGQASQASKDLNRQWSNFLSTVEGTLAGIRPEPEPTQASSGGAIVPAPKSDIELFGIPVTFIRYLNGAIKFGGKGLLISIAKTILETLIQGTLDRLLNVNSQTEQECIAFPIFPGDKYNHVRASTQLVLSFAIKDPETPKEKLSRWHMSVPSPIPCEDLDWCTHFDGMERNLGDIYATVDWGTGAITTCYCITRENARSFLERWIMPLSSAAGSIRITEGGSPKRKPKKRTLKCVEAIYVTMGSDGDPEKIACLKPPEKGCKKE